MKNIKTEEMAIISMACRLPESDNVSELWKNLSQGNSSIKQIPEERWRLKDFYSSRSGHIGKSNTKRGTFLNGVKDFDPQFFGIYPEDAYLIDPQQRIITELAYELIHSTKYLPEDFSGKKVGVFLGITKSDYREFVQEALMAMKLKQNTAVIGVLQNMIASRISHTFDLQGPSLTIDTACSSSLVALHLACESIISGSCESAIVGGINLNLIPVPYLGMAAAGALSSGKKYHVFDKDSDGFFMGEGGGLILIKKLSEAIRDKDNILGIIKGSAINNDGKSVSPMAPRLSTQQAVLREAYDKSGLSVNDIDYIEAHGTGTFLGDAIEAKTLNTVFNNKKEIFLGSIKPNIGHLLSGAGIASIIKVLLSFQNRKIPPLINYNNPRTELGLENAGFILNKNLEDYKNDKPMLAGINGFGFGGTNAHVILEEYQDQKIQNKIFSQYLPNYNKSPYWLDIDFSLDTKYKINQYEPESETIFIPEWKEDLSAENDLPVSKLPTLLICSEFYQDFQERFIDLSENEFTIISSEKISETLILEDGNKTDILILFPKSYQYLFKLFQEINKEENRNKVNRLVIVTEQAILLPDDEINESTVKFLTSGLISAVSSELGNISVKHLDLDKNDSEKLKIEQINNELKNNSDEIIVYRNNKRYKKIFKPSYLKLNKPDNKTSFTESGVYLITGGSSGIGLETARYISSQVKAKLILIGRRHQSKIKQWQQITKEINATGSTIEYFSIDVSEPEEVENLFNKVADKYNALNGIIHAAGVVDSNLFSSKTYSSFENILKSKVKGIELLTKQVELNNFQLDFFVAFSSISSIIPGFSRTISDYAVANYFLEQFCLLQQKKQKPFQVINWGPWSEHGMASGNKFLLQQMATKGINPLDTNKGLKILGEIIKQQIPHVIVTNSEIAIEKIIVKPDIKPSIKTNNKIKTTEKTINNSHESLQKLLSDIIKDELAEIREIKEIGLNDNLLDLGIDSLSGMEIINRLGNAGFKNLPFELIFENQTIKDIVDYLLKNQTTELLIQNIDNNSLDLPKDIDPVNQLFDLSPQQKAFFKAHNITGIPNFSYMRQSIKEKLDLNILNKTVYLLLDKYPLLRANFSAIKDNGQIIFKQRINPSAKYSDKAIVEKIEENESLKFIEDQFVNNSFDLEKDLLIKIAVVEGGNTNHLLILAHHIIFDGISMHLVIKDLWTIYLELIQKIEPKIKTSAIIEYMDYINYINVFRNSESFINSVEWWKNEIISFSQLNKSNNKVQQISEFKSENSSSSLIKIPDEYYNSLKQLIEKEKISYQFLLLTVYAKTLSQWANSKDVIINLAVTGRQNQVKNINNIVGCFADTLPICIKDLEDENNLIDKSQQLRNKWNAEKKYHNITSSDLIPLLKTQNINSIPFSFSFVAFNKDWAENLPFQVIESNARGFNSNTRLAIQIWEDLNGLNYTLNYPENLFSEKDISSFSDLFLENIISLTKNDKPLELVLPAQNTENNIIKMFLDNVRQNPEKEAIVYQNDNNFSKIISYKEADKLSDFVAGGIKKRLTKTNPAIAIIGSASADTIISLLGILKCGGIYIPVEKEYPLYRVEDMLKISRADLIIFTEDFSSKNKLKNIVVVDYSELINENNPLLELEPVNPESNAYVIFTSGSTGKPKGVPITYQAIFSYLDWCIKTFDYNHQDKVIQTSSICFDASVRQILIPLITGATLFPLSTDTKRDIKSLWNFVKDNKITVWSSVPSLWEKFVTYTEKQNDKSFSNLRLVKVGGEVLKPEIVRRWQAIHNSKIVNLYGPTETTINATYHIIDYPVSESVNVLPIGKLLPYFKYEIYNSENFLAKNDEKGELYISGIGVTSGYLNSDNKAKDKFFTDKNGNTFYKTGDIVSKDKNDNFFFHGRTDRQIKIRGFRIELEEIEQILLDHPLIISAVVDVISTKHVTEQLVAFICLRYSFISIKEIREYLAKELPEYVIPQRLEIITQLPLLENGKVDRHSLINDFINSNSEYYIDNKITESKDITISEKSNHTESLIIDTWKKLLNINSLSTESDFFADGGDSILLMQLFMDLEELIPNLPRISEFYKKPKLSYLLDLINKNQKETSPLAEKSQFTKFPLSPAQMGFYLSDKYLGSNNSYWSSSFYLEGKINVSLWKQSLEILQSRHQMLHVRLVSENPPYFESIDNPDLNFEFIDSCDKQYSDKNGDDLFNLTQGYPLIRHKLIRTKNNQYIWEIKAHHILADGLSCLIFGRELLHIYSSLNKNHDIDLPELKSQFSDFSFYMQEQLKNSTKSNQYWNKVFSTKYNEPALKVINHDTKEFLNIKENISGELWSGIVDKSKEIGCTPFIILLTAFYQALAEYNKQSDLIIGIVQNGRDYPISGIHNIFGCFAQALPLRINLKDNISPEQINNIFKESTDQQLNPTEIMKNLTHGIKLKSILGTQFFFSHIDYSALEENSLDSEFRIDWNKSESIFQPDNNDTAVFLTSKKLKNNIELHFSFNQLNFDNKSGYEISSLVINNLKKLVKSNRDISISSQPFKLSETGKINSLLIGYLPALKSLPVNKILADKIVEQLFVNKKAFWFDVTKTEIGNSGTILLPLFAEEIIPANIDKIQECLKEALSLANSLDVKHISLAGMLPSVTGFGLKNHYTNEPDIKITTGHSSTVAAVIKTLQKVLQTTDINLSKSAVTFVGLGSIGKGVLYTLLSLGLQPEKIILCDILTSQNQLEQIEKFIYENFDFKGNIVRQLTKNSLPEGAYNTNIIISAVSKANVIDIDKIKPGTILIDDSFPYCFDTDKAISRMDNKSDVLITGGGLLKLTCYERLIHFPDNKYIANLLSSAFVPDTMASCQFESLLMSNDNTLPVTHGLADYHLAKQYLESINKRDIKAPAFHIGKYIINQEIILKFIRLYNSIPQIL